MIRHQNSLVGSCQAAQDWGSGCWGKAVALVLWNAKRERYQMGAVEAHTVCSVLTSIARVTHQRRPIVDEPKFTRVIRVCADQ